MSARERFDQVFTVEAPLPAVPTPIASGWLWSVFARWVSEVGPEVMGNSTDRSILRLTGYSAGACWSFGVISKQGF